MELKFKPLNKDEKIFLLNLAKTTIKSALLGTKFEFDTNKLTDRLKQKQASFVTLFKNGHELRGCIGSIFPTQELYKDVIANSINASFNDPRFAPLKKEEFDDIIIEISILTIPQKYNFKSSKEILEFLNAKKPGIILTNSYNQATFLPSVWEELKTPKEFLEHLCLKAGLSKDCYQDKNTQYQIYFANKFSTKDFNLDDN